MSLHTAHAVSPAAAPTPRASSKKTPKKQSARKDGMVALDTASCLAEMLVMGSGLVEDVLLKE